MRKNKENTRGRCARIIGEGKPTSSEEAGARRRIAPNIIDYSKVSDYVCGEQVFDIRLKAEGSKRYRTSCRNIAASLEHGLYFLRERFVLVQSRVVRSRGDRARSRSASRCVSFNTCPIIIAARASNLFDLHAVGTRVHYTTVNTPSALFDIPREQDYYGIFSATTIAGHGCQNLCVDIRQYLPVQRRTPTACAGVIV